MKELSRDVKRLAWLAGGIFLLFLAVRYWPVLEGAVGLGIDAAQPLIIGCVMAYVINILMNFYEKWYDRLFKVPVTLKIKRIVCMIFAFLSLFGIVFLVVNLVLPELINCIASFIGMVPAVVEWLVEFVGEEQLMNYFPFLQGDMDMSSITAQVESLIKTVLNGFGGAVGSIVSALTNVFSVIVSVVIGLIFSIYVLVDKEKLGAQCRQLITTYIPKKADKIFYIIRVLNESFHSFIVGQVTEAVVLGVLCIIGMTIFRFPYAVMIGAFIGFTALIPIAGAYIGAVVGAIMMLSVDPFLAIEFIVFIIVLQQLEGNLIYPKVVGSSIGLPGIWVLTAVTVGGGILGIGGMLLAVPLFAAGYRLLREDIAKRNPVLEESEPEDVATVAEEPVQVQEECSEANADAESEK